MKRTRRRVEKEDFARVLLTETSTYDVPIIFSNLGFYWHWKKFISEKSLFPEMMKALFLTKDPHDYTISHSFKIRKGTDSYRTLNLIHPRAQVSFIEFYEKFDQQILLACQKSRFSIRYPSTVGSKYFVNNINEDKSKYRTRSVTSVEYESRSKHLTTYFAYRSHTRLHSFFDSVDFRNLEKKYSSFWSLDVARCFDSIYTHSVTWALKNKEFAKNNINSNSFGSFFDRLMQSTNYNETAGIVVGSEVSRIFSEIIFQRIDETIHSNLTAKKLVEGTSYTIRRYVDDIFIFAISEEVATTVNNEVVSALREYKLTLNEAKTLRASRPFITEQSKAMRLVKNSYKALIEKLLAKSENADIVARVPLPVFNRRRLLGTFLDEVKLACIGSSSSYGIVAGYLISSFSNLLISFTDSNVDIDIADNSVRDRYSNFYYFILEVIFHLYTVSPSQNGSIKIGLVVNSACIFFDGKIPCESNAVRSLLYTLSNDFFQSGSFYASSKDVDNTATIESLNILASMKVLGSNFLVSPQVLERIVNTSKDRKLSYFEIITLLFYIGDNIEPAYLAVKAAVLKSIKKALSNIGDLRLNSEKIHLLLDVLACPFIEVELRQQYARSLWSTIFQKSPSDEQAHSFQVELARYPWFASWSSAEILNSLEKKALLRSY